jgi:mRNA-degrading endonuclease RelE of RelBE toxin-antitoxin system
MNRIDKFLMKLPQKERNEILGVLSGIKSGIFDGMDIKKTKGTDGIYRVRKGRIRIIFKKSDTGIELLSIQFRDDNTYNNIS